MSEPRTYFSHADCWSGCTDPFCPYTHKSGWKAEGVDGLHSTEDEARAAALSKEIDKERSYAR